MFTTDTPDRNEIYFQSSVINNNNNERNLLRRNNDRDLALICWNLMAARERGGLGRIEAKHQKGHAERRKKRADFDTHEVYHANKTRRCTKK